MKNRDPALKNSMTTLGEMEGSISGKESSMGRGVKYGTKH